MDNLTADLPASSTASGGRCGCRAQIGLAALASALVCAMLFVWAIGTGPNLGDEAHHWRRATVYFETPWPDTRVVYDPAYPPEGQCAIRYFDSAGWHLALVMLWKVYGRPSFAIAQGYQLGYAFALMMFTYMAGRQLYGNAGGWWAWALSATMPLNLLFGMVFYMEVPAAAATAAAVYSILARRPVWLGLALAAMFYLKQASACVLAPPLLAAAFLLMGDTWRQRLWRTALAAGLAFVVFLPDMLWRWEHFGRPLMFIEPPQAFQVQLMAALPATRKSAIPMDIFDPLMVVRTFGVPGILALAAGLAWSVWELGRTVVRVLRRVRQSGLRSALGGLPDLVTAEMLAAGLPLVFYTAAFIALMNIAYDIRYFHPAAIFAVLLGGGLLARTRLFSATGWGRWPGRILGATLVLAMLGQAATVPAYVRPLRILPHPVVAGFEWIKANTAPSDRIMYMEFNITAATGRPIMWAAVYPRYLFTSPEEKQARILYHLHVQYIAIHPTRFIDHAEPDIEPRGLPIPWVRSLRDRPYLEQVYPATPQRPEEGGEFVVYRVRREKIPPEWVKEPLYEREPPGGE
ncbi:MAG: hypothetical protein NTY65_04825 [Planctomycetota bacterium]|nr:hypothetical protein [Planctomycetota bacterium]